MNRKGNQGNEAEAAAMPITVIEDRYDGTYAGGRYTAWNLRQEDIPHAISADDETCRLFWQHARAQKYLVGVGETREEAIQDLRLKQGSGYKSPKYLADWLP